MILIVPYIKYVTDYHLQNRFSVSSILHVVTFPYKVITQLTCTNGTTDTKKYSMFKQTWSGRASLARLTECSRPRPYSKAKEV